MKRHTPSKLRLKGAILWLPVAAALCAASLVPVNGEDAKPEQKPDKKAKTEKKTEKKAPLTGAELYALHCNRCHPERYATEWSASQWKTIMTHMRVRANLPASQAKAIMKYLQSDSGNP